MQNNAQIWKIARQFHGIFFRDFDFWLIKGVVQTPRHYTPREGAYHLPQNEGLPKLPFPNFPNIVCRIELLSRAVDCVGSGCVGSSAHFSCCRSCFGALQRSRQRDPPQPAAGRSERCSIVNPLGLQASFLQPTHFHLCVTGPAQIQQCQTCTKIQTKIQTVCTNGHTETYTTHNIQRTTYNT